MSEGKSARKGSGEVKVARATEGEREEREEGKERKKRGRGTVEGGGKVEEDIDESIVKPTRPIKVSYAMHCPTDVQHRYTMSACLFLHQVKHFISA